MGLIGLSGISIAAATVGLIAATGGTSGLSAQAAGSSVLSAIAARSPGFRVGGVALKSKQRRVALSPVGTSAAGEEVPETPYASVLGAFSEEGLTTPVVETELPQTATDMFPRDFLPGEGGSPPASESGPGDSAPGTTFQPPIGGIPGGGGGGFIVPQPTSTPTPEPTGFVPPPTEPEPEPTSRPTDTPGTPTPPEVTPPPPPPVTPVPEPATWLMLIAGFGLIGSRMRQGNRVAAII